MPFTFFLAVAIATAAENQPYLAVCIFVVLVVYVIGEAIQRGNFRKPNPEEARREGQSVAEVLKKAEDAATDA